MQRSESLVLRYTLTPEMITDAMMAISLRAVGMSPRRSRLPTAVWASILWAVIFFVLVAGWRVYGTHPLVLMMMTAVIGVVIGGLSVGRSVARMTRNHCAGVAEREAAEGEHRLEITERHVREESAQTLRQVSLSQIGDVLHVDGASVLVANGFGFVVPDAALPEGMTPERFRELILWWREG